MGYSDHLLPLYTVDSFSSRPFSGNPAGVCLDVTTNGLTDAEMQKIAVEMNISVTGFVRRASEAGSFEEDARFALRWFTPTREVPLCGHGTLAAAAVLFYCKHNKRPKLTFDTLGGPITAELKAGFLTLDMPLNTPQACANIQEFEPLIKLVTGDKYESVQEVQHSRTNPKLLIRMADTFTRADLEALDPPISQFTTAHNSGSIHGVIVTVQAGPPTGRSDCGRAYDFISRYFTPWNGIPEDPVTGSAHTVLAGYWSAKLGKSSMFARQCSRRGGDVSITLCEGGRVEVAGPATVVLRGEIRIQ